MPLVQCCNNASLCVQAEFGVVHIIERDILKVSQDVFGEGNELEEVLLFLVCSVAMTIGHKQIIVKEEYDG